jgi:hypothetical protein
MVGRNLPTMEAPEGFGGEQVRGPADPSWAIRVPSLLNWVQAVIAGGQLERASSGGTMAHWASGGRPGRGTVHMGARIFCGCRVPIGLVCAFGLSHGVGMRLLRLQLLFGADGPLDGADVNGNRRCF